MKVLDILQGPAYGDERAYNGLRLAGNLANATTSKCGSSASAASAAASKCSPGDGGDARNRRAGDAQTGLVATTTM